MVEQSEAFRTKDFCGVFNEELNKEVHLGNVVVLFEGGAGRRIVDAGNVRHGAWTAVFSLPEKTLTDADSDVVGGH